MQTYPQLIEAAADLKSLVARARELPCVALDTEFVWERTYYPILGLIQIGFSTEECFLIDAAGERDLSPLGDLLADPKVELILHDAPQDLTILRRATSAFPRNIFDTRCAAGFAGMSSALSLTDLVERLTGVTLSNDVTRTDWTARPLSDKQIAYALDDVRYLPTVRAELLSRTEQRGRVPWLEEELSYLDNDDLYRERDPRQQYRRIKGTGRFTPVDLAILRELASWREETASQRDRPRSYIVPDRILVDISRKKPRSVQALKSVNSLAERTIQRFGSEILAAVKKGMSLARDERPTPAVIRDKRPLRGRLRQALAFAKQKCEADNIDLPFVATRSEIKRLVLDGDRASPEAHRLLRGWRRNLLGDELLALGQESGNV